MSEMIRSRLSCSPISDSDVYSRSHDDHKRDQENGAVWNVNHSSFFKLIWCCHTSYMIKSLQCEGLIEICGSVGQ